MRSAPYWVVGADLSGPSAPERTAMAWFRARGRHLELAGLRQPVGDDEILALAADLTRRGPASIGLDAPLSYNMGGGDRPGDAELRAVLTSHELAPGTVMTPTMTRMAYLTLRGIAVARLLAGLAPQAPRIAEVHPAGAMVLRGAPATDIRRMKSSRAARDRLLDWLEGQGLRGAGSIPDPSADGIAALASALAAWKWAVGEWRWREPARPPHHPYDFVC